MDDNERKQVSDAYSAYQIERNKVGRSRDTTPSIRTAAQTDGCLNTANQGLCEAETLSVPPIFQVGIGQLPIKTKTSDSDDNTQNVEESFKTNFFDKIKIDFIRSVDLRIICRFLGVNSVDDIKNYPHVSPPLISFLMMENMNDFMENENFCFEGESNFDDHGNTVPTEKNVWTLGGKDFSFVINGFLFYKNKNDKNKNVVFFVHSCLDRDSASIICYTMDEKYSENITNKLGEYTKKNNCLRGAKIKDISMYKASFLEVDIKKECNWDNYYYPESVKDVMELEVFNFLNNVEKYNSKGIVKRGVLLHGAPGSGKSTIGHIICNNLPDRTVIWVTPDTIIENNGRTDSIKILYKLADFVTPCVMILEDLDLFSQDREKTMNGLALGTLMNILDGVNSINNSITIGTTNRIEIIEQALKNRPGRFDRVVEVPALDEKLLYKMFKNRLEEWKATPAIIKYIVSQTDGWTGAEAQEFVNTLNLKDINEEIKDKRITVDIVDEIIETLKKFGIGEGAGDNWGFARKGRIE